MVRAAIAALGTVLVAGAFVSGAREGRPSLPDFAPVAEQQDDPGGAARFEVLRLRDPATGRIPKNIRRDELAFASRLPSRESLMKAGTATGALAATWLPRGPWNIGGRTRVLAVDAANESVILAGGVSGGMWRSSNGGASWVKTTSHEDLHSVTCIAQDTRAGKTDTWYHGSGEYRGNSAHGGGNGYYNGNGVFKSTDNGMSWNQLPATAAGSPVAFDQGFDYMFALATDPSSSEDEVYAATAGGIQRSSDGGTTWTTVLGSFSNASPAYTDVAVTQGGVVYAALSDLSLAVTGGATGRGIYRSTNGGTWTQITPAGFPTSYSRIVLAVAPSDPTVVYFLVSNTNGTEGVNQVLGVQLWKYTYVSGNGSGSGGTWVNRGGNLPNEAGLQSAAHLDSQNGYNMLVRVKPDNPDVVIVGGTGLYLSTDGFATTSQWRRIGGFAGPNTLQFYANHHPDQHSGVFLSDNVTFLSGHDGGVARTSNITATTVGWTPLNTGYFTTQFYTIALDRGTNGNAQIIGGMQDNGTWSTNTTAASTPWVMQLGGDGSTCAIADGRTSYYASSQNGTTYRLILNPSGTLTDYTRVDPTGGSGYLHVNPFALDPADNNVLYMPAGGSLWMNSNVTGIPLWSAEPGGANLTKSQNWTNLTAAGVSGTAISALGVSKASPSHRLYYGTSDGRVYRLDDANAAAAGTAPADVWTGKGLPTGAFVSGIAVDPTDGDRALVVFSNYGVASVFLTTNGGTSWTNVEGNLGGASGPSCRTATIVPFGGMTTYFLGTSTGLYSTTELHGSSTVWAQEGSSVIGNVVVGALDARPSDGTVVAATHGAGVFSAMLTTTGVEPGGVPIRTALLQNYPNPFNPSTTIRFTLAAASDVSLQVFGADGREVETLVSGRREAGDHAARWVPRNLASGTYLYRLRAGGHVETRKLLYVK
jgi:hypothetical protein